MTRKPWYKSRTMWFNAITVMVYIALGLQGSTVLPADILVITLAVGNGILRWITEQGIK